MKKLQELLIIRRLVKRDANILRSVTDRFAKGVNDAKKKHEEILEKHDEITELCKKSSENLDKSN